jgi:hypothetical protein
VSFLSNPGLQDISSELFLGLYGFGSDPAALDIFGEVRSLTPPANNEDCDDCSKPSDI